MPRRRSALAVLLLVPGLAWAHSISDQLTVSGTHATATNPRSGSIADRLSGDFDLTDRWGLHSDLTLTRESPTPPPNGAAFGDSGGSVFDLLVGADFDATEQLTVGLDLDLSPSSTTHTNTSLAFQGASGATLLDGRLRTTASSTGATLDATWLSPDPDAEWQTALDASLGGVQLRSQQRITAIEGPTGPISTQAVKTSCQTILAEPLPSDTTSLAYKRLLLQKASCRELLPALAGESASLGQGTLALSLTETVHRDTDLGLTASYAFYSVDPTAVGFFTLATAGRRHVSLGDGIDVAPVRWTLKPRVAHRFGKLAAEASAEYAQYVAGQGHSSTLALRLHYQFNRTYRAFLLANGQNDVDGTGATSHSGSVGAGIRVSF